MVKKEPKPKTYMMAELKRRGWTKKMIDTFVPVPDLTKRNPVYSSTAPMKLYYAEKIETIEQSDEFKAMFEKSLKTKKSAKKAVATKRQNLIDLINSIRIFVKKKKNILDRSIRSYNEFQDYKESNYNNYDARHADRNSDPGFLERIQVNYVRHNLTEYDEHMSLLYKKVGAREAYQLIKNRTLNAIAEKYPFLESECQRQMIGINYYDDSSDQYSFSGTLEQIDTYRSIYGDFGNYE